MNMSMGAYLRNDERDAILSPSHPHMYVQMRFMYKEKFAKLTKIRCLLTPLNDNLWLLILAILFTVVLMILSSKTLSRKWRHFYIGGKMNRTPILNTWSAVMGHGIANSRIANGYSLSNFARTLIFSWVILWFMVRTAYESALYTFLQEYRPASPYDTIEKVFASDCKIVANIGSYSKLEHLVKKERWILFLL